MTNDEHFKWVHDRLRQHDETLSLIDSKLTEMLKQVNYLYKATNKRIGISQQLLILLRQIKMLLPVKPPPALKNSLRSKAKLDLPALSEQDPPKTEQTTCSPT